MYCSRAFKSLEDAQDRLYRGDKAAAQAAADEKRRAAVLPPPASPPTEEKRCIRAEKFGEISPQLDDVLSLSYHSGESDSGGGAHRKPVAGAAEADSRLSLKRPPTSAVESLRTRRAFDL